MTLDLEAILKRQVLVRVLTIATGVILGFAYFLEFAPAARNIATAHAEVVVKRSEINVLNERIKNRSNYEALKSSTLRELRRTAIEGSLAQSEASFWTELQRIAFTTHTEWRGYSPGGNGSTAVERSVSPSAPTPSPSGSAEPSLPLVPKIGAGDAKAAVGQYQGVIEVQPVTVRFRGTNANVLRAFSSLADGRVLVSMRSAGLQLDSSSGSDHVTGEATLWIHRVHAEEAVLFPSPSPLPATPGFAR